MPTTARVVVTTMACCRCGESSKVVVNADAYDLWHSGELIQRCFPDMSDEEREVLITGIHPKCWGEIFAEEA